MNVTEPKRRVQLALRSDRILIQTPAAAKRKNYAHSLRRQQFLRFLFNYRN